MFMTLPDANKTADYDSKMAAVYGHIYQDRYNVHANELADAKFLLTKNIAEFGLAPDAIKSWCVFNVGTGREAVAATELGARACHIADMSPLTAERIRSLQTGPGPYGNITPYHADLCSRDFSIDSEVDFVYLNGVYHHLYDPLQAAANLNAMLKVGGYVYFRLYRSGSLRFFIADFVRRFLAFDDSTVAEPSFVNRFGPFPKHQGMKGDAKVRLFEMCYDDMFVPTLTLFDPQKLYRFFEERGFEGLNRPDFGAYHHEVETKGGTAFSAYFQKKSERGIGDDGKADLAHTDQLDGIVYKEACINRTVALMKRALPVLRNASPSERCTVAFDLFYAGQAHRIVKFYNETATDLDIADAMSLKDADTIHARFHDILRPWAGQ